ncbi:hypothetical protein Rhopal_004222-T1 [Rhodotorula paludigena]|uniref:Proteophosphoglycan ppg4 n=1 Tax=Rhodotorula paludigena TaxID=86838 RepID=A0AAV5GPM5_9BASI|nr:hypothetical protein Rhopal_004222-T1 [Rhodotorula paludigena]
MPDEPKKPRLRKTSIDGGFDWTFRFEIDDLDLTDPKLDVYLGFDGPLAGSWDIEIKSKDAVATIGLNHDTLAIGQLGQRVRVQLTVCWVAQGRSTPLLKDEFEEEPFPYRDSDEPNKAYCGLSFSVTQEGLDKAEKSSQDTSNVLVPHDVRLSFPHAGTAGAEIWTTSSFLANSSPYLSDLLSSDFAESLTLNSKKRRRRSSPAATAARADAPPKDHADSDDETDELVLDTPARPLVDLEQLPELTYRQITVVSSAYTTYRAVIRWLETGYIAFLPLASTCKPRDPSAQRTRRDEVEATLKSDPEETPALPVSLKSTYRLAHLLQLDRLEQICLAQLPLSLTHHGAAPELFDNASVLYDEWRKVVIDYVVENWNEVTSTTTWVELDERIERDEVPGAAPILRKLMKARDGATQASSAKKGAE